MCNIIRNTCLFCLCVVLVFSREYALSAVEMDEVVVEAGRIDESEASVKDRAAFVTVIRSEDFAGTSKTFSDVLEETVGLNVRKLGGDGAYSTASIRGSSASQVTVLIDGVPLNRGKTGVVNLGDISLANVDRVEVYRGSAPMKFRASSIGGVINIVTKESPGKNKNTVSVSYGSFETYGAALLRSEKIKNTTYLVSCDVKGSEGDYEFKDDRGTVQNTGDDYTAKLENNDYDSYEVFGKIDHRFSGDMKLLFSASYFEKESGVQGPSRNHTVSRNTSLESEKSIINTKITRENLFKPGVEADISAWFIRDDTWFKDPQGEIGVGHQDNHSTNLAFGADSGLSLPWERHYFSLLGSFQSEKFDSKDTLATNKDEVSQKRNIYQLGFEDEISFFDDSFIITPQLLYTYLQNDFGGNVAFQFYEIEDADNDDALSLKLGCEYAFSDDFVVKANIGKYYRYPNFSELFGDNGNIIGTTDLTPEKGLNTDFGYFFSKKDFSFSGIVMTAFSMEQSFFYNKVDDLILFFQNSQRTVKATNISSATLFGLETVIDMTVYDHIRLTGNHTFQDTENTSDIPYYNGKKLPGVPKHDFALKTEVFNKQGSFFYEYNYMADNFLDKRNASLVKKRELHNAGIIVRPSVNISITLEAENISDNRFEDVMGYALPGRSFSGTLRVKF